MQEIIANICRRILDYRRSQNMTQAEFSSKIGVSRSSLSQIESGRHLPTLETIATIATIFNIPLNYLILGEKFNQDERIDLSHQSSHQLSHQSVNSDPPIDPPIESPLAKNPYLSGKSVRPLVVTTDGAGKENIVMVNTRAAAGYTNNIANPEYVGTLPNFSLPGHRFRNATYRSFEVDGDSMMDTIYNGEWVIGKYVENWIKDIKEAYIHVIVTKESVVVKRCLNRLEERGVIVIQSDNTQYPTDEIKAEDIQEIWYVVAKVGFILSNRNAQLSRDVQILQEEVHLLKRDVSSVQEVFKKLVPKND